MSISTVTKTELQNSIVAALSRITTGNEALAVAVNPGTAGLTVNTSGSSVVIPYVTVNHQGIVTSYNTRSHEVSVNLSINQKNSGDYISGIVARGNELQLTYASAIRYNVFDSTTNGLVPSASGSNTAVTFDTARLFLGSDSKWYNLSQYITDVINTQNDAIVSAFNAAAESIGNVKNTLMSTYMPLSGGTFTGPVNGTIIYANQFITTSDKTIKENIEPVSFDLSTLTTYRYNFKNSTEKRIGLIAQEVQQVIPEAVRSVSVEQSESDSGTLLVVDYNAVVAALVTEVNNLKKELCELKGSL